MLRRLRNLGPGMLVTAAFIGPGTVTTATVAGARFGYVLLWALGFSVIATIVLQEMSARLGVVSGAGLGEALIARLDVEGFEFLGRELHCSRLQLDGVHDRQPLSVLTARAYHTKPCGPR